MKFAKTYDGYINFGQKSVRLTRTYLADASKKIVLVSVPRYDSKVCKTRRKGFMSVEKKL